MSEALFLDVPANDQSNSLIHEYYDYRQRKRDGLTVDDESDLGSAETRRQSALDDFHETGSVSLYEYIPSDSPGVGPHYDEIVRIFLDEADDFRIEEPERIERVCDHLRAIKKGLQEMDGGPKRTDGLSYTPADREVQFEVGPIVLCEFALDRGYGVSFDY